MLAPRIIPPEFVSWNRFYGAPFGRALPDWWKPGFLSGLATKLRGPFGLQANNDTRAFEYPWAFYMVAPAPGLRVLEIGGGLSGLQFALDRAGCRVTNVDPGEQAGWPCPIEAIAALNRTFGTRVQLRPTRLPEAELPSGHFDRVLAISVLEHLEDAELEETLEHAWRCLKPGGLLILTVDLFLNLHPFCSRSAHEFGMNQDVHRMVTSHPFELVSGSPCELYGYPEFTTEHILGSLAQFLLGTYPSLAQCLVLRKTRPQAGLSAMP